MINIEELVKNVNAKNGEGWIIDKLIVGKQYSMYEPAFAEDIKKRIEKMTIFSSGFAQGLPTIVRNDDVFSEVDSVDEWVEYSRAESELYDETKSHRVELSSYRTNEENELMNAYYKKWNDLQEEKAKMTPEEYDKAFDEYLESRG